jgi:hypothetical protein
MFIIVPGLCPGTFYLAGSACQRPLLRRQNRSTFVFPGNKKNSGVANEKPFT